MRTEQTGAPTDTGMPATAGALAHDPMAALDAEARRRLASVADHLIPAAHGMPSAGDVVNEDRLRFVLTSRPDLADALAASLRPELGDDPVARLAALAEEPTNLAALQLAIVGGYYTDKRVKELIGYPGQMAIEVRSWEYPAYLEEGLIDAVLARGPVWRDPATGQRAVGVAVPRTYAERFSGDAGAADGDVTQGGQDGRPGT
jgi:hypothetical protein